MAVKSISLAISGASGVAYGLRLLECLLQQKITVYLMVSKAACQVATLEMGLTFPQDSSGMMDFLAEQNIHGKDYLHIFDEQDWMAPVASGSGAADAMVICPCSGSCLSAIACGSSNNLMQRAADVMLKEKRPLILVPREAPLSMIHLENMLTLAKCGATILPASPGFYNRPQSIDDIVDFMVARILDNLGLSHTVMPRWGEKK